MENSELVASIAALAPLILIVMVFEVWCLIDMHRRETKLLPRWAWMVIVLFSIPTGGIIYLLIGRGTAHSQAPR